MYRSHTDWQAHDNTFGHLLLEIIKWRIDLVTVPVLSPIWLTLRQFRLSLKAVTSVNLATLRMESLSISSLMTHSGMGKGVVHLIHAASSTTLHIFAQLYHKLQQMLLSCGSV